MAYESFSISTDSMSAGLRLERGFLSNSDWRVKLEDTLVPPPVETNPDDEGLKLVVLRSWPVPYTGTPSMTISGLLASPLRDVSPLMVMDVQLYFLYLLTKLKIWRL